LLKSIQLNFPVFVTLQQNIIFGNWSNLLCYFFKDNINIPIIFGTKKMERNLTEKKNAIGFIHTFEQNTYNNNTTNLVSKKLAPILSEYARAIAASTCL